MVSCGKGADLSLSSLLRVLGTGSAGTVWLVADGEPCERCGGDGGGPSQAEAMPPRLASVSEGVSEGAAEPGPAGVLPSAPRGAFSRLSPRRRRALKMSPSTWASEQQILAQLDHPFVVPFLGASSDEMKNYIFLEASVAGDLFALLRAQDALLLEGQARVLVGCLASAIGYVHSVGWMYRDLKPENVVMSPDGLVRLVDFGLTKRANEPSYTLCGTAEYLAPEMIQLQGERSFGPRRAKPRLRPFDALR